MRDRPDRQLRLPPRIGPLIQLSGLIRKEIVEIVRQPRVLFVLVAGPFVVLLLFAGGFDRQETVLVTTFVGPDDGIYEAPLEDFGEELNQYIEVAGYTPDLVAARRQLVDGEIDLIVVLPPDPAESVLAGERATIEVLHDKLDPIQQTAVDVSTQVAVQELNSRILEAAVGEAQQALGSYEAGLDETTLLIDELGRASADGDDERVAELLQELDSTTGAISASAGFSDDIAVALGADDAELERIGEFTASIDTLRDTLLPLVRAPENVTRDDAVDLSAALQDVRQRSDLVLTLDPGVIVRPFDAESAALERRTVTVLSFFATGAIALLLQHMVFTFAAMSLVTDRNLGLFELFRVGPIGPGRLLVGKYIAYTLIGSFVSAALLASIHFGLDVPMRGDLGWLAIGMLLLLIASIGFGSVVSMVSQTTTQAVQYALLVLLAALFFSGLFLDIEAFVYPIKALIWTFPATYGTRILRDVMLRGNEPATWDLAGLAITSVAFLVMSWALLRRRLRAD